MCGIVGYIGKRKAWPILVEGLKRLEYRGYDSAGAALMSDTHQLNVYKSVGKVADLERTAEGQDVSGCVGIAHTRWATHGEPSTVNAHPHCSQNGDLALVHNGIIENYAVLKEKLQAKGCTFKSSTDTEVLVQLIGYIQQQGNLDLLTAVQLALREVIGAYAIAVVDRKHPDEIIAARKSSPLVVGVGEGEFFLASDATPMVTGLEVSCRYCAVSFLPWFPPLHAERNLRPARLHQRLYAWPRESGHLYGYSFRRVQLQGTTVACRTLHYRSLRYFLACRTYRQATD